MTRVGLALLGFCSACLAWVLCTVAPARADTPRGLVLGGKLGAGIGKPLNEAGASFAAEVELGYALPPLDHAFELFAAFAYTAPVIEGSSSVPDARLPDDGLYRYRVEQQIAGLGLGLRYRLSLPVITPYAAAGARLYMMRNAVSGSVAGVPFGTNEETDSALGAFLALGAELTLGPGALLAELQIGYGGVDAFVLRDTNVGALSLMVGYRLMVPPPSRASEEPASEPEVGTAEAARAQPPPEPVPPPVPEPAPPAGTAPPEPAPEPATTAAPAATAAAPVAAAGTAQVRGTIRSFSGEPLRATIRIEPGDLKASTDEQGNFQLDVPPGRYSVRLRSFGYVSQTRQVVVEENGVTVLNVELGKK